MDKNIAGLLAVASVLVIPAAHAASALPPTADTAMRVSSYADLLKPIPNAVAILKASAAARANLAQQPGSASEGVVEQAQLNITIGRGHRRRHHYHHHHHHHHHHQT